MMMRYVERRSTQTRRRRVKDNAMKTTKLLSLFAAVLVTTIATSSVSGAGANWTVRNKPRNTITVVAHRGAGDLAPENSISSLVFAWGMGCVPEVDVRQTSDGHIVMFHDGNFARILPDAPDELKKKGVADLTYDEVRKLDISSYLIKNAKDAESVEKFRGEKIASIEEIVAELKKDPWRHVVIDVKTVDLKALAKAIYDVRFQVTLTTDRESLLEEWQEVCPNADGTLWMGLGMMNDEQLEARFKQLREKNFKGINRFHLHVTRDAEGNLSPTPEFIRSHGDELRRRGIEFQAMPWPTKTCPNAKTDAALFRELLENGAMGFGADRPDVAFQVLDEFYADSPEDWNIRDNIPIDEVVIMGHRGMGEEAPEGTLETFQLAWSEGIVPEADIRMTKDGVFVSFHDENFARIIPDAPDEVKKQGVKDVTLEELLKLDVGAYKGEQYKGQHIVTLKEIIEELKKDPKRMIFCDIKEIDINRFADETREVHPQICLTGPDVAPLAEWKKIAPHAKSLIWMPTTWAGAPENLEERFIAIRDAGFYGLDFVQVHVTVDEKLNVKPGLDVLRRCSNECRKHGITFEVITWTNGDRESSYYPLLDAGLMSFATDYPSVVKKALEKYYADDIK